MRLSKHQIKIIPRIRRKYNVSIEFLKSNLPNIEKFLWYALSPRLVIKRVAIRKGSKQRVILNYYHLRRVLFDKAERKVIKTRRRNVQQWSRQMVSYLRKKYGIKERIEITSFNDNTDAKDKSEENTPICSNSASEDVSKQLKEQLELLRTGKRTVPLIENENKSAENSFNETESIDGVSRQNKTEEEIPTTSKSVSNTQSAKGNVTVTKMCDITPSAVLDKTESAVRKSIETTPEKQIMGSVETRSEQPKHNYKADKNIYADGETVELPPIDNNNKIVTGSKAISSRSEISNSSEATKKTPSNKSNFLDMLMNKVRGGKSILTEISGNVKSVHKPSSERAITPDRHIDKTHDNEHLTDSGEEFFGFDETERLPGMMLTPIVPFSAQSKGGANGAFISESLNEFMRENSLENNNYVAESTTGRRHRQTTLDGLVTPDCVPPRIEMPLVPESLQKLRTVAERRQYLQKFNKNHKLAIINNEAAICRELQRKMRHRKSKSVSQQVLQAPNSQMPFTRQGWKAASFVTTEFNHYYYQTLKVNDGNEQELVRLPGVRGNNDERNKQPYLSRVPKNALSNQCDAEICGDALVWRDFKPLKTEPDKKRLNESPLPTVFKPCPLSHKPFQKPLDDETAPLLLAGGSMAVVRMPIVELEVFPALGKPLHEVAKRYLECILPHGDITREWAEFSVSTLQKSADCNKKENSSNAPPNDKINSTCAPTNESYAFPIPYLNDRSHILVRRVVDRSEKLDETFETATTSPTADFSFRKDINENDNVLVECADVLGEIINSVAISCSENSFIKVDPDGLQNESDYAETKNEKVLKDEKSKITGDDAKLGSQATANKKQNRLLLELRRLNATIIDAAVKAEKGTKPCTKEFCALGCVCQSLAADYPLRQHCGKSKCVIECTCKGTNQSRIMRLETDGRSITTEDAFMLRRQATARLARMEKEFTSTIVLTENETLLINESQYDKKRRCTKAPKRYEDRGDTDDDFAGRSTASISPQKTQNTAVVAIETATPTDTALNSGFSETTTELREPIYVMDKVLEKLKHSTVPLVRFEGVQNMAVWCMVHELYKCYCGGRAIEGKPLIIEKDNNTTSSDQSNNLVSTKTASIEREFVIPSTKARYSFDKVEAEIDIADEDEDDDNSDEERGKEETRGKYANVKKRKSTDHKSHGGALIYASTDDEKSESDDDEDHNNDDLTDSDYDGERYLPKRPKITNAERQETRGRPSEMTFINKYFKANPNGCRRIVAVPRKTYLRLNRKRRKQIHEYIAKHENKQSMLLLNEHILRSVYYHKNELEKQRKEEAQDSLLSRNKRKLRDAENSEVENVSKKESCKEQNEPVQKKSLSEKEHKIVDLADEESCQSSLSSLHSTSSAKPTFSKKLKKKSRRQKRSLVSSQTNEKHANEFDKRHSVVEENSNLSNTITAPGNLTNIEMNEQTVQNLIQEAKLSEIQKSDNEITLSDDAEPSALPASASKGGTDSATADISTADTECSAALSLNNIQSSSTLSSTRMDFFRDVVRSMNSLVNKKMQDIGLALKRESKVIPAPNNEILCIIKWSNFLDAFVEGFVFIWQVKLRDDQSFYAATISNVMPMVLNAVGVVNIEALPIKQLPLLGRMLMERCRNQETSDLAIVMQGRTKYWLVKGFLRADKSSACAKPTPKSHPLLTRKINVLSSLLAKQHIRELNKKAAQKQNESLPDTIEIKEGTEVLTQNANSTNQPQLKHKPPPLIHRGPKIMAAKNGQSKNKSILKIHKLNRGTSESKIQGKSTNASSMIRDSTTSNVDKSKSSSTASLLQELVENNSLYTQMKTNIAFRKVNPADIEELHGLDVKAEPHRWLVLDLCKDFSHIYVPDFQELVSLDRIQKVMAFSRQKQKIVKLQFFQNAAYDAFVTPVSESKLYFGPLKLNLPPPSLILLQSVDGKMMLREVYQQMHNIQSDTNESTTAFWMVRKNGQVHFDFDITDVGTASSAPDNETVMGNRLPIQTTQKFNNSESDDDDCMIVENNETRSTFAPLVPQSQPNITVKPLAELQPQTSQSALPVSRTNFTIQTSSKSNRLQITNLGTTPNSNNNNSTPTETPATQFQMITNSNDNDILAGTQMSVIPLSLPLSTQLVPVSPNTSSQTQIIPLTEKESNSILCGIPQNAVITGVAPAPQDASYGTTIFISSLPTTNATDVNGSQLPPNLVANVTTSNSLAFISPATASIISSTDANCNSNADSTVVVGTPTIRYITPDVRVTATGASDSLTTATQKTVSSSIKCASSTTQQENVTTNIAISSSQSLPAPDTTGTITKTEQANAQIPDDWKRFLMDEKSKTSTIGATTITKMVENLECAVNGISVSDLQIPLTIQETEFEPAASIVFKPKAAVSTANMPNESQTASSVDVTHQYHATLNDKISVIHTATTAAATTTITAKSKSMKPSTPMVLSQPFSLAPEASTVVQKTPYMSTKAQVMTLPYRKIAPSNESNKLIVKAVTKAKSTTLPYSSTSSTGRTYWMGRTTATTTTTIVTNNTVKLTTNTAAALPTSTRITFTNAKATNQSLVQRLKAPPQPLRPFTMKPFSAPRLSMPSLATSTSATATNITSNLTIASVTGGVAATPPKPLINVRPAIPIPQRISPANPVTKRYSDSALLASSLGNSRVSSCGGGTTATTASVVPNKSTTVTTSFASRPQLAVTTSTPSANTNNNNTTLKMGITKSAKNFDEQYGVFCSSASDSSPRFWAKRVKNSYIVKVPGLSSVVHRADLESVGTYLNQHLMSQSPAMKSKLPIKWKFVPSDQLNLPIKMLKANHDGSTSEKILIGRFKAQGSSTSTAPASSSNSTAGNFLKDDPIASNQRTDKNCSETILIED
ncbi:serine-rich adhesin for platelets [Eurosta solidaginis]|uniref:serine-rich adhesin for platelets n=1 Tax=Eurosta solidaginis TaxID=178769 RepID=UPI003530D088